MSFRDQVADEVKEAAENSSNNEEQETLDQIEVDLGETPFVKFNPTAMVTGTFPEDEGNPIIRFPDSENNDGRRDQGYLGLVMDDVGAETDEFEDTIVLETENDSTDYRIFDSEDKDTKVVEGMGVKFGDRLYEGEVVDADNFADRAIVVVDRTAAVSVARKIDVNGAVNAGMDEETGQPNGGLIEYAPDEEDTGVRRRYARNPELREELYGEEIGILVSRREEMDEDYAERVADDDDPARQMYWYSVFTMDDGETIEPTEGEPVGYSFLEWRFDPTAGHLEDDQWEFVQEYIANGLPTDEDTIATNIEENSDQFDTEPNTERMTRLIQNEVTAE